MDLGETGSKLPQAEGLLGVVEDHLKACVPGVEGARARVPGDKIGGEWKAGSHGPLSATEKSVAFI